jgi:hypothetical protein
MDALVVNSSINLAMLLAAVQCSTVVGSSDRKRHTVHGWSCRGTSGQAAAAAGGGHFGGWEPGFALDSCRFDALAILVFYKP